MSQLQHALIFLLSSIIRTKSGKCRIHPNALNFTIYRHEMIYYNETNSIYLFGGKNYSQLSNTVYKWNLNEPNSQFQQIGTTPTDEFQSYGDSSVLINDTVYFLGVDDGSIDGDARNLYKYQIPSESWLNTTNLSKPSIGAAYGCLATNDSHLFWFDGHRTNRVAPNNTILLWIYDILRDQWQSYQLYGINGGTSDSGWHAQYCYMVNNDLYVFGGKIDSNSIQSMYRWDFEIESLINIGQLPHEQYKGATVYHQGIIHLVGNEAKGNDITSFKVDGECIPIYGNNLTLITAVTSTESVVINDSLYVIGGINKTRPISAVQICDLSDDAIASCTMPPTIDPTIEPTEVPTSYPSHPSLSPSNHPSISPTMRPTMNPTLEPTVDPTIEPTQPPTLYPSSFPSEYLTALATMNPTSTTVFHSSPTMNPKTNAFNIPNLTIIILVAMAGLFVIFSLLAIKQKLHRRKLYKMDTLKQANPNKIESPPFIENVPKKSSQPPLSFINDSDGEQAIVDDEPHQIEIEGKPRRAKPVRIDSASSDHGDDDSKEIVLDEGEFVVNGNSYKNEVDIFNPELDEEVIGNERNTLGFDGEDGVLGDDEFVIQDEEERQKKTTTGEFDENEFENKNKDEEEEKMETNGNRQEIDVAVNIADHEIVIVTKGNDIK